MAGTVISKKGLQLIAKLVASGTALTFTRASVGTGSIPSGYDPKNMTDLNSYKMDGLISSCSSSSDEASIIMQISSMGVETGFTITETGLFAMDPDEGEILYAYLDLSKDPQYVYAEDGAISKFVEMTLIVKVGSVERVTAYLNPKSLVTRDGNISETVIETLDTVEDKYPIPAAGESVKRFLGKVLTFLRNIRPLTSDITFYVSASIGSDSTGDGSQDKPFKTIQHAIDLVPKDLGRYKAQIIVLNGIYPEKLIIENFRNGNFSLLSENGNNLTDNCRIINLRASWNTCYMNIGGFSITTTSDVGIYGYNNTALLLRFIKITENALSIGPDAIYLAECKFSLWNCQVSYHNRVLTAYNSHGVSNNWVAGTGNNYGLYSSYGSRITTTGTQPAAATSLIQDAGGMFTYGNGSQIAGPFTLGLSCTWGGYYGGYVRHGNYTNGQAMVTISLQVSPTVALSAFNLYRIHGFPIPAIGNICVQYSSQTVPANCYLENDGAIVFQPAVNVPLPSGFLFSATYLTNS